MLEIIFNELKNIWFTNKEVWHMQSNWLGIQDEYTLKYVC